jgi:four helix bundle protein
MMNSDEFKQRTEKFALRVIRLVSRLPKESTAEILGRQLLRAATSVGANYRAACRARSKAEFRAKLGIVEKEADECLYWFNLLVEGNVVRAEMLKDLKAECNEILAMVVASIRTTRSS